jgi:hypothetical protein
VIIRVGHHLPFVRLGMQLRRYSHPRSYGYVVSDVSHHGLVRLTPISPRGLVIELPHDVVRDNFTLLCDFDAEGLT